jgi:hypothetical protein
MVIAGAWFCLKKYRMPTRTGTLPPREHVELSLLLQEAGYSDICFNAIVRGTDDTSTRRKDGG